MNEELEKLLLDLKEINFEDSQPLTYLEICKYPYSRFEEICSRVLAYFFNPQNEHGLKDLFLKSFFNLKVVKNDNPTVHNTFKNIKVNTEQNAEGKRLDLVIYNKEFIIGVENKITASLYNPLANYKKLIEDNPQLAKYKIVLSVKKITDKNELILMQKEGFVNVLYSELINEIKYNIGGYINNHNNHSTYILNDFIKTIENMSNNNYLNGTDDNFFIRNSKVISELIQRNDDFQRRLTTLRCNNYNELVSKMKIESNNDNWWVYECSGIGINKFEEVKDIGLECVYEFDYKEERNSNENALGNFLIYITAWDDAVWEIYESKILERLKLLNNTNEINKEGIKTIILFDEISNNDFDKIISALKSGYKFMSDILEK